MKIFPFSCACAYACVRLRCVKTEHFACAYACVGSENQAWDSHEAKPRLGVKLISVLLYHAIAVFISNLDRRVKLVIFFTSISLTYSRRGAYFKFLPIGGALIRRFTVTYNLVAFSFLTAHACLTKLLVKGNDDVGWSVLSLRLCFTELGYVSLAFLKLQLLFQFSESFSSLIPTCPLIPCIKNEMLLVSVIDEERESEALWQQDYKEKFASM